MRSIKAVLIILLAAAIASTVSAEVIRFQPNSGQAGFDLTRQDFSGVGIRYSLPQMAIEDMVVDGQTMKFIRIPGVLLPNNAGAPNLPGDGRMIAIPQYAGATYRIISSETEVFENIDIAPAPPIQFENDYSPATYEKDPEIYNRNADYPESPVMLSEPAKLRGVDYVILGITPFQYNPVTKRLIVYKNIEVEVTFTGGNGYFGDDRLRNRYWEPILRSNLINYETLPKLDFNNRHSLSDEDEYEYIIIIPDDPDFEAWADTIAAWRNLQGILTGVVPLSEIGGNNATAIENYINDAYNNWTIAPVAFLLLSDYQNSGDTYGITSPVWNSYCISDNIYADVDGDDLPDLAHARITAQDNADLEEMITKFLDYERNPPTDEGFYDHPVAAGGWQSDRWFIICTDICYGFWENVLGKNPVREYAGRTGAPTYWSTNQNTYMLIDYFGPDGLGYIPEVPSHLTDWGGNATRINNDINSGCFILLHRDHGSETGWSEPSYNIGNLSGLHNDMLPWILSINCLTGKYNSGSQCFAEAFHRMHYGALGITAASEVSYSFVNDTYIFGLMDYLWPNFDPGYGDPGPPNLNPCFANASGKYYLEASSWPYNPQHKVYTDHLFHSHGGAFVNVYSEVPQNLTVNHANILFSGFDFFTVTADEGALIGLTVDGEIIGTGIGTGSPLDITIEPQVPGGTMIVTVTKPNYYRYQQSVNIIPPEGYGVIEGYVRDLVTHQGLEGMVTVTNRNPQIVTHCQPDGYYSMYVPADTLWDLRAEHTYVYLPSFARVSVAEDDTVEQDFDLEPKVEVILKASFGNPDQIAYRTFYFRGSWDDDGFYNANWECSFSPMRDDGVPPDEVQGDGIFTGSVLLATDVQNTYSWAVYAENYNDDASRLQDGADFQILDPGSPPTVPVLEVNPTGMEHNFTLTAEDITGIGFDLTPGYQGQPHMWYGTVYIPAGVTGRYVIKVMRTDDVYYGDGGVGGARIEFTPPVSGNYTVYFNDNEDLTSTGANLIITPAWLEVSLTPGDSLLKELTFDNNGVMDLGFSIPDDFQLTGPDNGDNVILPDPGPVTSFVNNDPKPRTEEVTVPGPPVSDGSGGPDLYGYKWIDSDEPNGPEFGWVDISSIGTPLNMSDDQNMGPYALPFNFNFYGNYFNSIRVCSNGWISFTSSSTAYTNYSLPSASAPENLIAPMWDDLNPGYAGQVYYYITDDSAVVSWEGVPRYYNSGSMTFQVVILSNGLIYFNFLDLEGTLNSATVGQQNDARNDALQMAYNTNYLHDSLTVRIAAGWLEVDPLSGTIPAGGNIPVNVRFDGTALELGEYTALITVHSWDTLHALPDIEIPVRMHVLDQLPDLDLTMWPAQYPVVAPAGGSFDYEVTVLNRTGHQTTYDAWLMLTLPNGNMYGPLVVASFSIGAREMQHFELTQDIPRIAPIGDYTYHSYVGDHPGTIIDQSNFPFEVIPQAGGDANEWTVEGFDRMARQGGDQNMLPTEYALSQNYPNPFNSQSVISFAMPEGGKVSLNVYNLMGQRVATLVNGYKPAGYHTVTWDASQYSSGVYFYKLSTGNYSKTRRMTLLK